ncbi:MAG: hydrogenase nickel incorporation protein HypB [Deltaproteobacteria bacterium]|nr:hydrogenase nickel incorporation protein HypB [Deltaproteobacteria bacterium]
MLKSNRFKRVSTGGRSLTVQKNALESNEINAKKNKAVFGKAFVMNILSSPGSGKTSLLESIVPALKLEGFNAAVIEGDVETDLDKKRIDNLGVPAYQIITNGTCHLDAKMVNVSLNSLDIKNADVIFIENVGNLVCPTSFNLGEDMKVVVLSVTEGDDKPLKYPAAFYKSKVMIINKTDLLPALDSDIAKIKENALSINKELIIFETSCRKKTTENIYNKGIADFVSFVKEKIRIKAAEFQKQNI